VNAVSIAAPDLGPAILLQGNRIPGGSRMATTTTIVNSDPEILGGTAVFTGTRVPIQHLRDYLVAGDGLDVFLDAFPTVTRDQAVAAIREAFAALVRHANPAG
jgi:uncharacterized protein (DUF433 family)